MNSNFGRCILALLDSNESTDVLFDEILCDFPKLSDQSFDSLLQLHHWIWRSFTQPNNSSSYETFIRAIALFDKQLVFEDDDGISLDMKLSLFFSFTLEQIEQIFNRINQCENDNDTFISLFSTFFNNLIDLIYENPIQTKPSVLDYLDDYILSYYIITDRYRMYIEQLGQGHLSPSLFSARFMFYIRTCSFYIRTSLTVETSYASTRVDDMIVVLIDNYLSIVRIHSRTVASWNETLLQCITHILGLMVGCCCFNTTAKDRLQTVFTDEMVVCNHLDDLLRIMTHQASIETIENDQRNDKILLIDSILFLTIIIVKAYTVNWFLQSKPNIRELFVRVAEHAHSEKLSLRAYAALGAVLTSEQLKELDVADRMVRFFFKILDEGWHHPLKKYQRVPIQYVLKGFEDLFKSDSMQQKTADLRKVSLLIEMCYEYPIAYDILWTLSFNSDIQQQLQQQSEFITHLNYLAHHSDNDQIRKVTSGILWNLGLYDQDHPLIIVRDNEKFDIMISYSHKDKQLCRQLYDELIKQGYRVWIDFDQMHGNVMDAMAQAIDQSQMVIICMSEDYRRSNFCRAEAQYAFQRQRKMFPVLFQKHYKPDGWLSFLLGPLLYIDFMKHEFTKAMEMLFKELQAHKEKKDQSIFCLPATSVKGEVSHVQEWTKTEVQEWLLKHQLTQMARLLVNYDGRGLLYFHQYVRRNIDKQEAMALLDDDVKRKLNERLSLIEIFRFSSLMDQEK